jgi:integrase
MLARYARKAGLAHNMPPHRLRHFLFTWLKVSRIASDASFGTPSDQRGETGQRPGYTGNPFRPR